MWIRSLRVENLRSIASAELELGPGLNAFVGRNAQGKTSVLEAIGLLARGRSFRTEHVGELLRRGTARMSASALAVADDRQTLLEVRVEQGRRRLHLGGVEVPPRDYHGRLEALVYATDRLRVVSGSMRERRQYFDRGAASLWPAYRQLLLEYERVLAQRNAALEHGVAALEAWDERLCDAGARLRLRRAAYLERLQSALERSFRPRGERYRLALRPGVDGADLDEARGALARELAESRPRERRARRTLVGPHRDAVELSIDEQDAAAWASAGQARSLLLALTEAALAVYREERGTSAVALLDDLDSELDEERSTEVCRQMAARGQALVTTAHAGWGRRLGELGRVFEVEEGRVRPA